MQRGLYICISVNIDNQNINNNMTNFSSYYINTINLRDNISKIKQKSDVKFCAMVKANAYNHGIKNICPFISDMVDFMGVASYMEACKVRKICNNNILVVGKTSVNNVNASALKNISITVSSLNELISYEKHLKHILNIHIKVDTGLNRFGVKTISEFKDMLQFIDHSKYLKLQGVFTHFATKSEDEKFITKQHRIFAKFVKLVPSSAIVHCANSYVSYYKPALKHNMVRSGFYMYGGTSPFLPVLSIISKVISVHNVHKGDSVGYDLTYRFAQDGRVGIVPLGYADGFDRRLSNNFSVIINNQWVRVIGNVCMDVFFVDLTGTNIGINDVVTILGTDHDKTLSLHNYAQALGTSEYDIMLKFRFNRMDKHIIV